MKKERTKEFSIRMLEFKYENGEQDDAGGDNELEMTFGDIKRLARKLNKMIANNETKKWKGNEFFVEEEVKRVNKWDWE